MHKFFSCFTVKNIALFLFFICLGGGISLFLGQDVCFDLQNYHLYIPYAFLHGRMGTDIIPAGALHTFFNPLLDVPSFLLFFYLNNWPLLTGFLMGGIYGLFLFVLWKTLGFFFGGDTREEKCLRVAVLCLAGTGIASLSQIGRFTNEVQTAVIGMIACWFLCKSAFEEHSGVKYAFAAVFAALRLLSASIVRRVRAPSIVARARYFPPVFFSRAKSICSSVCGVFVFISIRR